MGADARVERVKVDVASKTVRVDGGADGAIRAAIQEAGYEVDGVTA